MASKLTAVVSDLRHGLGAIKLRSDVKKVTLMFSRRSDNAGARYTLGHSSGDTTQHGAGTRGMSRRGKGLGKSVFLPLEYVIYWRGDHKKSKTMLYYKR